MKNTRGSWSVCIGILIACSAGWSCTTGSAAAQSPASTTRVSILPGAEDRGARAFAPSRVVMRVGDTVMWTNNDRTSHAVRETHGIWNSGVFGAGLDYSVTLDHADIFAYHCTVHPSMVGTIEVVK